MLKQYKGHLGVYQKRCEARLRLAKEQVAKTLQDDAAWGLFKKQVRNRGLPYDNMDKIRRELTSKDLEDSIRETKLVFLQMLYYQCMEQICDSSCDYNPRPRKGSRRYDRKKRFVCDYRLTQGDVLAVHTNLVNHWDNAHRQKRMPKLQELLRQYNEGEIDNEKLLSQTNRLTKDVATPGAYYLNSDPQWKQAYNSLSQLVVEEHKNPLVIPDWLDTKKNLCKRYHSVLV